MESFVKVKPNEDANCAFCGKPCKYLCYTKGHFILHTYPAQPLANGYSCIKCYHSLVLPAQIFDYENRV